MKIEFNIKRRLDDLLIKNGYVLDFSDRTFEIFIFESIDENIWDEKYQMIGASKGNRLRGFWDVGDSSKVVKLNLDLLEEWDRITDRKEEKDIKSYEMCKNYFKKLLNSNSVLIVTTLESKLDTEILTHKFIIEQIEKANKKIEELDYSGAITNSRTLIEQVLKELCLRLKLDIDNSGDLQKLYKPVANSMNLKITENSPENIKQILSGFINIINGISPLRNLVSDAHGRFVEPPKHIAKLAVNSSFTICDFLLDSYEYQYKKGKFIEIS